MRSAGSICARPAANSPLSIIVFAKRTCMRAPTVGGVLSSMCSSPSRTQRRGHVIALAHIGIVFFEQCPGERRVPVRALLLHLAQPCVVERERAHPRQILC